jgi:hypothetical protein
MIQGTLVMIQGTLVMTRGTSVMIQGTFFFIQKAHLEDAQRGEPRSAVKDALRAQEAQPHAQRVRVFVGEGLAHRRVQGHHLLQV